MTTAAATAPTALTYRDWLDEVVALAADALARHETGVGVFRRRSPEWNAERLRLATELAAYRTARRAAVVFEV